MKTNSRSNFAPGSVRDTLAIPCPEHTWLNARPYSSPLPHGEGEASAGSWNSVGKWRSEAIPWRPGRATAVPSPGGEGGRRCILSLVVVCLLFPTVALAETKPDDLQPIFNGKDLTGWKVPEPNPFWKVVDGVLVGENDEKLKGSMLYTKAAHTNFVLELEVRWSGEIDSGVMLRNPELQVQFGVSRSLKRDMTGAFYLAKSSINPLSGYPEAGWPKNRDQLFKPDDWNKFRLEARGDTFTVWLNGAQVTQFTDARYSGAAPIGLQVHPGLKMKVEFRDVRLKKLD